MPFVRAKAPAGPADRVILWIIEIVHVVGVDSELWRKKLRVVWYVLLAGIAGHPGEIRERKRLRRWCFHRTRRTLFGGLRLDGNENFTCRNECRTRFCVSQYRGQACRPTH